MHNPRSPARVKPSQVPTLPQLVAPWQHEETTPNRPHLQPHTSPCQPSHLPDKTAPSFPSSDIHHSFTELEKQGKVSGAIKRLEDLESRMAGLEQANLLRSLDRNPIPEDSGRERGRGGRQVELERLLSEMAPHLTRLKERVLQNEQRILREEVHSTTLVQLTQDTERKVLETQREVAAKREEQGASLEELRERAHQLEQRQLQLANFSQGSQEGLAAQLRRVGEETRRRVETMSGSVGEKMNALEHRHSALERSLQGVSGAVMGLNRENAELKKQLNTRLTEVRTGLSEVEGRLANVGRDSEKQDTQLRESFLGVQSELGRTAAHLQELFLGHLRENSVETGTQISELQDQVLEAMRYSRQECCRERDNLRRELETRIAATEEVTEVEKRECEARLKDLHSAVVADCGKIRSELTKELKATLQVTNSIAVQ
ncbi:hypothetical protein GBAR_LOCUS9636 [Geodia barretti]|uniref:Uncharacterized protein n=1 Tax=Geodia barretti TaxID=519541 RepID=A0AA35RQ00_GEOBA|nr:hypothetical protein GBAR_LOCUS9636 [Geodia barretti]